MDKFVWMKHYRAAKSRCNNGSKSYGRDGIKMLLTKDDVERLWFRDMAYKLKEPSIDRLSSDGDYEYSNCRFIELKLNKQLPRRKPISSKSRFKGVRWQEDHKKYRAVAVAFGKDVHIGYFESETEAALAYNKAVSVLFNQKIVINKV